jgi:acyl-CoA synthetase (NDP forming)
MKSADYTRPSTANTWKDLFQPDSVAVIGASNVPGSWGFGIMQRLLKAKKRRIYPVNPAVSEVMGTTACASVVDIPGPVDLAVIVVSALQVPSLLQECVLKGIRTAIIISGGFSETGEAGRKLETELVNIARQGNLHFVGPNTMGHMDTGSQLSTLPWTDNIPAGPVALLAQSGNMGHRILYNGRSSGIGFGKFVSTGNEADLRLEDYLEYLAKDNDTRIITAYIEGLREGRRFLQLAKEITVSKPIIVIKTGGTEVSARAATSHTGAIAGSNEVYAAAFRQSGVIRVEDDDELCDVASALIYHPLPRNNQIGILSIGGGPGVMAAEACEKEGLVVPPLLPSTIQKLDACLPPRWSQDNPVDMGGVSNAEHPVTFAALQALFEDENVGAILFQAAIALGIKHLLKTFNPDEARAVWKTEKKNLAMVARWVREYQKPVFMVRPTPEIFANRKDPDRLRRQGICLYPSLHRAVKVLRHLAWYGQYLDAIVKK